MAYYTGICNFKQTKYFSATLVFSISKQRYGTAISSVMATNTQFLTLVYSLGDNKSKIKQESVNNVH